MTPNPAWWVLFFICAAMLLFSPLAQAGSSREPDVVFVTTPHEVVSEMLRLVDVQASDRVFDLGSGDGRIVIAAARDYGARGTGIEINPELVELSRRNALEEGVSDRVEFIVMDLFQVDLRPASVVTLYLLPDLNLRLRPLLFEQLKPGSRVVSHAFDMGGWAPDEQTSMGRYYIYAWVIPANVSGRWEWRDDTPGSGLNELHLEQTFQQIKGSLRNDSGYFPISWASLRGEHLMLVFDDGIDQSASPAFYEGKLTGERLEGTFTLSGEAPRSWTAQRLADSKRPLVVD